MTDRLTIVLTLKDRGEFTDRWMRYMNDQRCPHLILIADGGSDVRVEAQLRDPSRYPQLRYEYVRYPVDTSHNSYYLKLADIVGRVTTPYVLLADNDDFLLLDPLPSLMAALDAQPENVSAGGQRYVLRLLSNEGRLVGTPAAAAYEARLDTRPKSVAGSSAAERLCYFMTNVQRLYLWSSWYCVHRVAPLAAAFDLARRHAFRDPVSHEAHVHMSLLAHGGYQQLPVPALIIQAGSSQFTAALERDGSVVERFVRSNAFDDLHRSLDSIGAVLADGDRDRVLKAIAVWIGGQAATSVRRPAASRLNPLRWFGAARPQSVRLPVIEPYILEP
jgi:glycosyltransferase domain-containing protein